MRAWTGEQRRRGAGFTLIEIMVAMVLAAIAIIGLLALYMSQTRASGFSRHSGEAAVLAQDMIERQRTIPSASLVYSAPTTTPVVNEPNINERGLASGVFTRKTYVIAIGSPIATAARIQVVVSWVDDNQAHSLTVNAVRDL